MVNLCPAPLHYDIIEFIVFLLVCILGVLFVRSFDSSIIFLSFSFVIKLYIYNFSCRS